MKRFLVIIAVLCSCCVLGGCTPKEDKLNSDIIKLETRVVDLKSEIEDLKTEKDALTNEITDVKIENGTAKYIVTFNIKQSHFTLDISQHLKDSLNDISIQIPVDKEYYDSVEVGDVVADDFRVGSLIFKGSFGNWDVRIEDKVIQ